ncbi:hypothetical protein J4455_02505 [Candidatus Woesearchaeota archaeon]|nr:hypothetical protein [Candidatus Woesearchaeota archaeon]
MKNILALFSALILMISTLVPGIVATESDGYRINSVEVDGVTVFEKGVPTGAKINVERGETSIIEVVIEGNPDLQEEIDDVTVEAKIFGYEHGSISDETSIFTVQPGVTYRKVLRLEIPEDFEPTQDGKTLRITVSDNDNSVSQNFRVFVSEVRHRLNILDVIFNPGLQVESGSNLFSIVRIENLGEKKEENIKVSMSISELGLSNSVFIDELVNDRTENDRTRTRNDNEESSASSDELFLRLPKNAKGEYELKISVDYNRGNSVEEKTYILLVSPSKEPTTGETPSEVSTVVTVDTTKQEVEQGKGAVFKFMFANLGDASKTYTLDVTGVNDFGTYRVDPQSVTVAKDQTGELALFVAADEDASKGVKNFNVKVMEDTKVIKQASLSVDVKESKAVADPWSNIRTGLEVGFFILLIILVILGLVIAARRMGRKDNLEEPSNGTQSYY